MSGVSSDFSGSSETVLVFGLGITGLAVVRALHSRGIGVLAADDRPSPISREVCAGLGIDIHEAPSVDELSAMLSAASSLHPTPGLPESHAVFSLAAEHDVAVISEFDLAQRWDDRPLVAITGTDGKTSVCTMATQMLVASGVNATMCGNTDVPLIEAIEDPSHEVFIVEASSFRLAQSDDFGPSVGTWLNYGPDHLDVHSDLSVYENSKAKVFTSPANGGGVLVANADDPVVMKHLHARISEEPAEHAAAPKVVTFGRLADATFSLIDGVLVGPDGPILRVEELWRSYPHDIENVLAAAASVLPVGATLDGIRSTAKAFVGLPHRVQTIASIDGVRYVNDSKATVPHATLSAIESFSSESSGQIVLLAGGRNKGLDLSPLAEVADHLRAVIAIGDAAGEVQEAFARHAPDVEVHAANSMAEAVASAKNVAVSGDVVLLSPACASFDWYRSYGERGDDFIACVASLGTSSLDTSPHTSPHTSPENTLPETS